MQAHILAISLAPPPRPAPPARGTTPSKQRSAPRPRGSPRLPPPPAPRPFPCPVAPRGFYDPAAKPVVLNKRAVDGIQLQGGTILGTSRGGANIRWVPRPGAAAARRGGHVAEPGNPCMHDCMHASTRIGRHAAVRLRYLSSLEWGGRGPAARFCRASHTGRLCGLDVAIPTRHARWAGSSKRGGTPSHGRPPSYMALARPPPAPCLLALLVASHHHHTYTS